MGTISGDPAQMKQFLDNDDGGPIVMINLLRFRAQANYPEGSGHSPCTGREAYARYGAAATPHLAAAGASVFWRGTVHGAPIAPAGETWDDAILIQYPSRQAFIGMVGSPEYRTLSVHRSAALEDSRLIGTTTTQTALGSMG